MKTFLSFFLLFIFTYSDIYSQDFWNQTTTAQFNGNTNFNINTINDELKLTNDVGNGVDGNLYIPPGGVVKTDLVKTAVQGNNPSGQNGIQVNSASNFTIGDEVFIITIQDKNQNLNNNLTGLYEFKRVIAKTSTLLVFESNLLNAYDTSGRKHQVIKVPNYNNITIDFGGTLTCDEWNGTTGGIVCFRAKGLVKILATSKIDASNKGFRGGDAIAVASGNGFAGEGIFGLGIQGSSSNSNAGGGGGNLSFPAPGAGGGGGSHGTLGTKGQSPGTGAVGGDFGIVIGNPLLSKIIMGGAGGSGSCVWTKSGFSGNGGRGGGIIYLSCDSVQIIGMIKSDGEVGGNQNNSEGSGGGGGGAGGSIFLISNKSIQMGNNFITSLGGPSGLGYTTTRNGGIGGKGRIRIDAAITGTSDPSVGYTGVTYAFQGTSLTQLITKSLYRYWGVLVFNFDISAPGTDVKVDIYNSTDSLLFSNVGSGTNMHQAGLLPSISSIKLKANLLTNYANQTPILSDWVVDWLTDVNDLNFSIPINYKLNQNYPNPFNPTTTIEYALPHSENVSIKVFDILGREVTVLVDEFKNVGYYSTSFDARNFTSGIYFYRIQAGSFVSTRKMMVVR